MTVYTCFFCGSHAEPLEWLHSLAGVGHYACKDTAACHERAIDRKALREQPGKEGHTAQELLYGNG